MLQVYKLLTPHFVFTLRMNANARTTLTNVTGILEVNIRAKWQQRIRPYSTWLL